jgi:hypothetical protein
MLNQTEVPCIDISKLPTQKKVMCLKFHRTEIRHPGDDGPSGDKRSCPHPYLLTMRSINSYWNMVHHRNYVPNEQFGDWKEWRSERTDESCKLVLLPSCEDVDELGTDCLFCKAEAIVKAASQGREVTHEVWDAARNVVGGGRLITQEEIQMILDAVLDSEEEVGAMFSQPFYIFLRPVAGDCLSGRVADTAAPVLFSAPLPLATLLPAAPAATLSFAPPTYEWFLVCLCCEIKTNETFQNVHTLALSTGLLNLFSLSVKPNFCCGDRMSVVGC